MARRYKDVKEVGKHNLEPVDLICGGFPCQDVSVAGKRAGLKGKRSGLWFEMFRVIRELRPRYALIENVPDCPSVRWIEQVLCDLASIGYDAEWTTISAKEVGAPHLRKRVFIVAYASGNGGSAGVSGQEPRKKGNASEFINSNQDVADTESERCGEKGEHSDRSEKRITVSSQEVAHTDRSPTRYGNNAMRQIFGNGQKGGKARSSIQARNQWTVEPDVGRVAYGVPARVHRLRALGNAVVPQVAQVIGEWIVNFEKLPTRAVQ